MSTQGQISAVGTVISAGYGFICGAYMPISSFSSGLQKVISFLPGTYGTALMRNHAMQGALAEMEKIFLEEGVEVEIVHVGNLAVRGCVSCGYCGKNGKCVFDDLVNEVAQKFEEADGMVLGSPVYFASANATLIAFLDRLFYSTRIDKRMKVGASVAVARRGGCSATFDQLNKYFTINNMPIVASNYWNEIHGNTAEEAAQESSRCLRCDHFGYGNFKGGRVEKW